MLEVHLQQTAPIPLDCTFACASGELVALVGPSGGGKTTVLRCIAGLHPTAKSVIRCQGQTWCDEQVFLKPQQRASGFVVQNYSLMPHLSALKNVALALDHLPPAERAEKAREWLQRVHLDGLDKRRPAELSGGQQQRVALARALARAATNATGVLLLDEPFSAVDHVTKLQLRAELARLRRELAIPVVLVTHDLDEARQLADRLIVLHHGRVLQEGPPEEVLLRPRTPTVARLMGLTNVFSGRVVQSAGAKDQHGQTSLEWAGRRLVQTRPETGSKILEPSFGQISAVRWVIPAEGVLLHIPGQPALADAENPVSGTLTEALRLGSLTQLTLAIPGESQPLTFQAPSHVIERNGLGAGSPITVSLRAELIHLMRME